MMDAMTPASRIAIPKSWERKIAARWKEWEPITLVTLRPMSPADTDNLRMHHRSHLITLLQDDIEMRVVRRLQLDDPRCPRQLLTARYQQYLKNSSHPRYTRRINAHSERTGIQPSPPRG